MASRKGWRRDMEGSLSVDSTPGGMEGWEGKGKDMIERRWGGRVEERESEMKGRFPVVVKTVKVAKGRCLWMSLAKCRRGIV